MLRKIIAPALLATTLLAACEQPTGPSSTATSDDFALAMFGEAGSSLEGTMGPMPENRAFDGRTMWHPLPDSIALTQVQKDSIAALRLAFRTAHAAQLDSLKAIFEAARAARQAGATREEVRAILITGRPIAEALRPDVIALHQAIWAVFTPLQKAWFIAHRRHRDGPPIAGPRP